MRLPSISAFGLATGFAVATPVNYAVSLALGRPNTDPVVAASGAVTLLVVTLAASNTGLAVWLAERRLNTVVMWGVVVALLGVLGAVMFGPWTPDAVLRPLFVMLGVLVAGMVAMYAANGTYARHLEATSDRLGTWEAAPDSGYVRRTSWLLRLGGLVVLVGSFASIAFDSNVGFLSGFGGAMLGTSFTVGRSRSVEAYPEGLVVRQSGSLGTEVYRWWQFDAVERTDDALVFRRRLPVPVLRRFLSPRYALADLEAPDRVERLAREHVAP